MIDRGLERLQQMLSREFVATIFALMIWAIIWLSVKNDRFRTEAAQVAAMTAKDLAACEKRCRDEVVRENDKCDRKLARYDSIILEVRVEQHITKKALEKAERKIRRR